MTMELILVFANADPIVASTMLVHPSPSSTSWGEFAACHMALVKVVLPEVYAMSTILKEAYYRVRK